MTMGYAIDRRRPTGEPAFLNRRSQVVYPTCFAIVLWDGPGDTLYAFEDPQTFERQCASAGRHCVRVHWLTAREAADWIAGGRKAVLYEVSVGGVAAFGTLKLASG